MADSYKNKNKLHDQREVNIICASGKECVTMLAKHKTGKILVL